MGIENDSVNLPVVPSPFKNSRTYHVEQVAAVLSKVGSFSSLNHLANARIKPDRATREQNKLVLVVD